MASVIEGKGGGGDGGVGVIGKESGERKRQILAGTWKADLEN